MGDGSGLSPTCYDDVCRLRCLSCVFSNVQPVVDDNVHRANNNIRTHAIICRNVSWKHSNNNALLRNATQHIAISYISTFKEMHACHQL